MTRRHLSKRQRMAKCRAYWKRQRKRAMAKIQAGGWAKPKPISQTGRKRTLAYKKAAELYHRLHDGEPCCFPGCGKLKWTIHHKRGRIGSLLTDLRYFTHLCIGHHELVHSQPATARALGLLAKPGDWNRQEAA